MIDIKSPADSVHDDRFYDHQKAVTKSFMITTQSSLANDLPIIQDILLNPACSVYSGVHCSDSESVVLSHKNSVHDDNFQHFLMAFLHHLIVCLWFECGL